jgi:hypothetical protein
MSNNSSSKFEVSVSELNKLLELCERALEGLSKARKIPKAQRQDVRDAVGDTCELIDSILTTVKQRLSDVRKAVLKDDPKAKDMIVRLDNASEWEGNYRRFHICGPLRDVASELRNGVLGRLVRHFSFKNPNELKQTIENFLQTEAAAGEFVSLLLQKQGALAAKLHENRAIVADELQNAKQQIQDYRDKFIDLEKKVRAAI